MATIAEGTVLAPPQDWTVLGEPRQGKPNDYGYGQYFDAQATDGTTFNGVYKFKKFSDPEVKAGDTVHGQMVQGKFGPQLKGSGRPLPTNAQASQTSSQPASQAQYREPRRVVDEDPEAARIARSVAVKGAVDLCCHQRIEDGQLLATADFLTRFILTGERAA